MKRFFTLLFLLIGMVPLALTQTVLAPGDLALLGVNCDNPDDLKVLTRIMEPIEKRRKELGLRDLADFILNVDNII